MHDECKMDVVDGVGVTKKRLGTWDVGRSVETLLISKYWGEKKASQNINAVLFLELGCSGRGWL